MSLFPEWVEDHKDDEKLLPKRIRAMHGLYGKTDGKTCKACIHLLRFRQGTYWHKCNLSKMTKSTASDWRAGWPACGKYEESKVETTI